jgi:hypothetical protein
MNTQHNNTRQATTINEPDCAPIRVEKRECGGVFIGVGHQAINLNADEFARLVDFARENHESRAVTPAKARLMRYRPGMPADVL